MDNKIIIAGDIENKNVTVIGVSQAGKTALGKQFVNQGYYYFSLDNLVDLPIDIIKINGTFNIESSVIASSKQNIILANILDLMNSGITKIVFDDTLTFIDIKVRQKVFKYMADKGIKFVNITMDVEDALFTDYVIVMFEDKVALEGSTLEVLKEEKIIKRMGLSLPFVIDLSIQLQYYGLVDKIYLNNEELVDRLWN